MRISWDTIGLIVWCIVGVTAAQTLFDINDPKHCILVCPQ